MARDAKRSDITIDGKSVVIRVEMATAEEAMKWVDEMIAQRRFEYILTNDVVINDKRKG
jgi:hypothetical protein